MKFINIFFFLCIFAMSISAACNDEAMKTDNWTQALSDCKQTIAANPDDKATRQLVIFYAEKLHLWNLAISELLEVIKIEEKYPDLYLETRFEHLGKLLASKGDYPNALLAYIKAAQLAEDNEKFVTVAKMLEANAKSAFNAESKEKLDENIIKADQILLKQIEAKSSDGRTLKDALKEVNKLLNRRPFLAKALLLRGEILKASLKGADGLKDYELAVKLQPWDSESNLALASLLFGNSVFSTTRYDDCIAAATRVILNQDSLEGEALRVRGFCREKKGEKEKALEDFFDAKFHGNKYAADDYKRLLVVDNPVSFIDDPKLNLDFGNQNRAKKNYRAAIYYYNNAIESPRILPLGLALGCLNRGLAYRMLKPDSYVYAKKSLLDFIDAAGIRELGPENTIYANFLAGEMYYLIGENFAVSTYEKDRSYDNALQRFEISLNLPGAEQQVDIKKQIFLIRCAIAKRLMGLVKFQKSKNRKNYPAKLTEKLTAVVAKIEADFKVYSQDKSTAGEIGADYINFALEYEEFKKLK